MVLCLFEGLRGRVFLSKQGLRQAYSVCVGVVHDLRHRLRFLDLSSTRLFIWIRARLVCMASWPVVLQEWVALSSNVGVGCCSWAVLDALTVMFVFACGRNSLVAQPGDGA
jgi:hypothetical protein